ncbi:MAG: DNA-processing protein DprA [Ignavibacteriales bacterium]|nr:DNA-processing protein DprA [Ignavibacteriales bacterium]
MTLPQIKNLAADILANNGCLISEYEYDTQPSKYFLLKGIDYNPGSSLATVVIETDVKGGTMHTVKFTKEQNRLLYCISHPLDKITQKAYGNQLLLEKVKQEG